MGLSGVSSKWLVFSVISGLLAASVPVRSVLADGDSDSSTERRRGGQDSGGAFQDSPTAPENLRMAVKELSENWRYMARMAASGTSVVLSQPSAVALGSLTRRDSVLTGQEVSFVIHSDGDCSVSNPSVAVRVASSGLEFCFAEGRLHTLPDNELQRDVFAQTFGELLRWIGRDRSDIGAQVDSLESEIQKKFVRFNIADGQGAIVFAAASAADVAHSVLSHLTSEGGPNLLTTCDQSHSMQMQLNQLASQLFSLQLEPRLDESLQQLNWSLIEQDRSGAVAYVSRLESACQSMNQSSLEAVVGDSLARTAATSELGELAFLLGPTL